MGIRIPLPIGADEMINVWGRQNSGNVVKVLWCLDEVGKPYSLIETGGTFGGNKEQSFLKMNPNGRVPVMDDSGFTLWESNVIVRYLAASYASGSLWPEDPKLRADADRWMDWPQRLQPFMTILNTVLVRTPVHERDNQIVQDATGKAASEWAILNRHLDGRLFVGGENFTIGDIALGNLVYRWFNLPLNRPEMPFLRDWYIRLTERVGYRNQIMRPLA